MWQHNQGSDLHILGCQVLATQNIIKETKKNHIVIKILFSLGVGQEGNLMFKRQALA